MGDCHWLLCYMPSRNIGEAEVLLYPYLTLVLGGMGGHCLAPAAVATGKRTTKHATVGWVGLGVNLNGSRKSRPHGHSNTGPLSVASE
jgi:hypothetical protein